MPIHLLRLIDRLFGPLLLWGIAPVAWAVGAFGSSASVALADAKHVVVIKLKGGGSLIVALPALLALRRAAPKAKFSLVCTADAKIYAELTGLFDSYAVISDHGLSALAKSSFNALVQSQCADLCVDLEANSILASVFAILTRAKRRIGFAKPDEAYRARAYTDALSFNIYAPVYHFYDQIAALLGMNIPSVQACRDYFRDQIKPQIAPDNAIGIAAFTSDFAPERMMPPEVWAEFLKRRPDITQIHIFGSAKNKPAANEFIATFRPALPHLSIINKCGEGSLRDAAANIAALREFWSVDSGLLHIARLLGVKCVSFWGPTRPEQRLRPMRDDEVMHYSNFACSPCVHIKGPLPCGGDNRCMKSLADSNPDRAPLWLV